MYFAIVLSVFMLFWRGASCLPDMAFANYVALHLTMALTPHPVGFHHPTDVTSQQHLAAALSGVDQTLGRSNNSSRLPCLLLRASLAKMDWEHASDLEAFCTHDIIRGAAAWRSDFDALRGFAAQKDGRSDEARVFFRQSLANGDGVIGVSLASPLAQLTDTQETWRWCQDRQVSLPMTPQYLLGQVSEGRWVDEPQPVGSAWLLAGFSPDQKSLENGSVFAALLYWQPVQPGEKPPAAWRAVGNYWVQCVSLLNFVPNSGFEWSQTGLPGVTSEQPSQANARIEWSTERGDATQVSKLLEDPTSTPRSLSYGPYPVEEGCYYLQAGWLASDQGWPVFGRVWQTREGQELLSAADQRWMFGGLYGGNFNWLHFASVVSVPLDAQGVQILVLDWTAPGWVSADDLLFVPLAPPDAPTRCRIAYEASLQSNP